MLIALSSSEGLMQRYVFSVGASGTILPQRGRRLPRSTHLHSQKLSLPHPLRGAVLSPLYDQYVRVRKEPWLWLLPTPFWMNSSQETEQFRRSLSVPSRQECSSFLSWESSLFPFQPLCRHKRSTIVQPLVFMKCFEILRRHDRSAKDYYLQLHYK